MAKNMISLNSLPLGDLPDDGLITMPGDKVTIRDRVVIHETAEGGKKVVKLYRQEDRPQQIEPAPAPLPQPGIKRSGSPLPRKPKKKQNRGGRRDGPRLTEDQERRCLEITEEKKWASDALEACIAEREAIRELKARDPWHPDITPRATRNGQRTKQIEMRARENGILRRALNVELNSSSGSNRDWEDQQLKTGTMGSLQTQKSFGQPHIQRNATLFNEQNSDPSVSDPYRNAYFEAPGYQNHPQRFFPPTEYQLPYSALSAETLPKNKIHPSRLSLMSSNAAMPEPHSTMSKVLKKVTGENSVPLARSRIVSRAAREIAKHERESPELGEVQEYVAVSRDSHVDSRENLRRGCVQVKQETIDISSLEKFPPLRTDEATAWLDANIPVQEAPDFAGKTFMQMRDNYMSSSDESSPDQMRAKRPTTKQAHEDDTAMRFGLEHFEPKQVPLGDAVNRLGLQWQNHRRSDALRDSNTENFHAQTVVAKQKRSDNEIIRTKETEVIMGQEAVENDTPQDLRQDSVTDDVQAEIILVKEESTTQSVAQTEGTAVVAISVAVDSDASQVREDSFDHQDSVNSTAYAKTVVNEELHSDLQIFQINEAEVIVKEDAVEQCTLQDYKETNTRHDQINEATTHAGTLINEEHSIFEIIQIEETITKEDANENFSPPSPETTHRENLVVEQEPFKSVLDHSPRL